MIKRFSGLLLTLSNRDAVPPRLTDPAVSQAQDGGSEKPAPDCAIWNDIARALELKSGGVK